jgi:hypothetical protein
MGPTVSSRTVEVKPYTLPRFEVEFSPDRTFYLPGDIAEGSVSAHYFFGKPVAGGEVHIQGFLDTDSPEPLFEVSGETDADGRYVYEFAVPTSFAGQLGNNSVEIDLDITVIDTANHAETIEESITVAEQPLLIEAVPESGVLRPGVENLVYLNVTSPDGRSTPAELTVTVGDGTQTLQTDEFGLATITVTPSDAQDIVMEIQASPLPGGDMEPTVQTSLRLPTAFHDSTVLLRPERAEYQIGETLNLDIYVAGEIDTVYLDVAKEQQTFGLVALPVEDGLAQAALALDGSLLGTLDLNVYGINERGNVVRDRRFVLVNPAPAQVDVTSDQPVYRPGETATLDIQVSRDGQPMPGALGVSIVDESVFALGAQDAGFARTYFLLDRELSEPHYGIRGFAPIAADDPSSYDDRRRPIRSNAEPIAAEGLARNTALFGLFGQELAHVQRPASSPGSIQDQMALARGIGMRVALALPLFGFAFYDGSRRRRHLAIGLLLLSLSAFFWGACAGAAPAAPAAEGPAGAPVAMEDIAFDETTATRGEPEPPRLRQYFPETLFWAPQVETDADGHAQLQVPIADSITTWRVSVLASDGAGNLGSAETALRVFQDFFVEPDLPRFLTVGDEIAVPVSLFNYLDEAQTLELSMAAADWFEFLESPQLQVEVQPNEVAVAYLPIRVTDFGRHTLTVTAIGSALSDAVQREVEILPDGQAQTSLANGELSGQTTATVTVPAEAIPGTGRLTVKIYPGVVSQVLDGLAGMLQMPYGCFEQTSSVNYPNVMVLDYLRATDQLSPQLQVRAGELIKLGYQRLLTFETEIPGGFSFYGDPPPLTMLTAYGLMQFNDMSRVSYVDPALIQRMAVYLLDLQLDDHWSVDEYSYAVGSSDLATTAYITWALAEAGYGDTLPLRRSLRYLTRALDRWQDAITAAQPTPTITPISLSPLATPMAEEEMFDLYTLALVANALIAADPRDRDGRVLLDELVTRAQRGQDGFFWGGDGTVFGGYGDAAHIETTALIAIALLRSGHHPDVAQAALDYLIAQRNPYGAYPSTQSTILVLKALLLDALQQGEEGPATVTITFNRGRSETITIDDSNADVVQQVIFDDIAPGEQIIELAMEGDHSLQYQVAAGYYLPWSTVETDAPERQQAMRIDVAYDRTQLAVNETVGVTALIELLAPGNAGTVLVELGVPPGLAPLVEDLDALVAAGRIDRYELAGRQIRLYVSGVSSGLVYQFNYRLRALYPVQALVPDSRVYDYYTPERQDVSPPQRIQVTLDTP